MASPSPPLMLALQGGGAHGAFTWGVLDALLEDGELDFAAISATSSGAVNAVALVDGWIENGRDGARERLATLWQRIGARASLSAWTNGPLGGAAWLLELGRHLTPAQLNPLGLNPLAAVLEQLVDFERLRRAAPIRLHLAATRVRDGALTLFGPDRISLDAVLASACLPQLFRAVVIDGETYWDGGYAGNPALAPLVYDEQAADLLAVLVQPIQIPALPVSAREIGSRVQELAFSTTFLRELEGLTTNMRLLDGQPTLTAIGRRLQALRLHLVEPGPEMAGLGAKSRLSAGPSLLASLHRHGREQAQAWLAASRDDLGRRSSYRWQDRVGPATAAAVH